MQTLARLGDELRTNAIANLVVGDAAVLAAAVRADSPGRAVVLFAVVTAVLAVLWGTVGATGRVRKQVERASRADDAAALEPSRSIRRRVLIGLVPVTIFLAALVAWAPESAAVIAGVPAGVGAADLWVAGWLRRFEGKRHDLVLRETPPSPFTGGQRTIYTRPMNEATDAT